MDLTHGTDRHDGQGMVEIAVILALVSIVAVVALAAIGTTTADLLGSVNSGFPSPAEVSTLCL